MREQGAERLLHLMTQLPDALLEEAISYQVPKIRTISWNKGHLVAACLCICLIGGLAWGLQREPLEETGATTLGIVAGGTAGGQGEKPTLAQSDDQTGARPVDSTDESPADSTDSAFHNGNSDIGMMVSEFWYGGQLYVDTGILLEELPESCVLLEPILGEDRVTKDKDLIGANVYRKEGDTDGLYVETEGGYRYYGRGSAQ